jgi:hypothetical protein
MNTERKRKLGKTLIVALAVAGIAQACGKDNEPVDVPTVTGGRGGDSSTGGRDRGGNSGTSGTDGGETSGGTVGTGGTENNGGSTNTGGTGNRGGSANTGGTGTGADGGSGNEGGAGPDGCVRNPTAPEEFLIRCTNSRCSPFDNAARIPGFDGDLPDL